MSQAETRDARDEDEGAEAWRVPPQQYLREQPPAYQGENWTASTALPNSIRIPSPISLTTRPRRFATVGSMNSPRCACDHPAASVGLFVRAQWVFSTGTGTSALILALPYLGNYALLLLGAGVMGLALFAVRPVVHGWLMDLAPPAIGGSATALMFALQGGLSVAIPWLGGLIADAHGFTPVFWLLGAAMAATTLIAALVPRRRGFQAHRD